MLYIFFRQKNGKGKELICMLRIILHKRSELNLKKTKNKINSRHERTNKKISRHDSKELKGEPKARVLIQGVKIKLRQTTGSYTERPAWLLISRHPDMGYIYYF